jgi:RNA recognition motif-containing protein
MTTTIPNASITPTVTLPSVSTIDGTGKKVVIQNVYIGSIDRLVTQAQLHAIFSQFGQLTSLHLPADPATGLHRGYAFLAYSDAKSANLAIKTMAGQSIAGRQLGRALSGDSKSLTGNSKTLVSTFGVPILFLVILLLVSFMIL